MRLSAKILAVSLFLSGYQALSQDFSLQFDAGDSLTIPNSGDLSLNNNFTIQAWIYPTSVTGNTMVISKGVADTGTMGYALYLQTVDNRITARVGDAAFEVIADFAWVLNTWTHVAMVHRGTEVELYVNGGLASVVSSAPDAQIDAAPLVVAGVSGSFAGNVPFAGQIDELLIFDAARSSGQISASYYQQFDNATNNLVSAYHFNEGTGTVAPDNATINSGSADDATFGNTPTWDVSVPFFTAPGNIMVTSSADAGPNTLREAIALANTSTVTTDTTDIQIDFTGELTPITPYQVVAQLRIHGQGNDVNGQNATNLFFLDNSSSFLALRDLRLVNANSGGNGGAIINNGGTLRIDACTIDNSVSPAGDGGAILSSGTLEVKNSSFVNNQASGNGGAVFLQDGTAFFENTTMVFNQANLNGGAFAQNTSSSAVTLINCTIANNTADSDVDLSGSGGGIYLVSNGSNSTMENSIVYGNSGGDIQIDSLSAPMAHSDNFVGTCGGLCPAGYDSSDPLLNTTTSSCNGVVQYFPLQESSPAIGAANPVTAPSNDACDNPRDGSPDAGAVEYGGGPSPTGYSFESPVFGYSPLGAPTSVPLMDDELSPAIPIGFGFNFFDTSYDSVYIGSDGYLTFFDGSVGNVVQGIPSMSPPNGGLIAGFWGNLDPVLGGSILYQTLGTAPSRTFVVEYQDIQHASGGNPVQMQIKLFEGSDDIEIHCMDCPSPSTEPHTQGIENQSGDQGLSPGGRSAAEFSLIMDAVGFSPFNVGNGEGQITFKLIETFDDDMPPVFASGEFNLSTGDWELLNVMGDTLFAFDRVAARLDHSASSSELITPPLAGDSAVSFQYALAGSGSFNFDVLSSVDGAPFSTVEFSGSATSPSYTQADFNLSYPGSQVRLKIVSDGSPNTEDLVIDEFDAGYLTQIITIINPPPGADIAQGESGTIQWVEFNIDSAAIVVVEFSPDGGNTFQTLAQDSSYLLQQRFFWTVDSTLYPVTQDGKLRVRTLDNLVQSGLIPVSVGPPDFGTGEYEVMDVPFLFETLASSTQVPLADDQESGAIPLPFGFNFYGSTFSEIYLSSNGFISFLPSQGDGCCSGTILPEMSTPNGIVAGYWADLDPGAPGSGPIEYQTIGTAPNRIFVIHYNHIEHISEGPTPAIADFQIKLFEGSNAIEVHCQTCEDDGEDHTQGIEDPSGTKAAYASGRTSSIFPLMDDAVRFALAPTKYDTVNIDGVDHILITDTGSGTGTVTFTNDKVYVLQGPVFVNAGQLLTIQPGTVIKGTEQSSNGPGVLTVSRGASINASGTASNPIVFTSVKDDLLPPASTANLEGGNLQILDRGLWGGVYILGNAPISDISDLDSLAAEGLPIDDRSYYGGTDAADNSGIFQFVSVRHAGAETGAGDAFNPILLAGVGNGSTVGNLEVYASKDDGVELLGGTVNVINVLVNSAADDLLDIAQGYMGTIDNFKLNALQSDHALEVDGPEGASNLTAAFNLLNGSVRGSNGEMADFRANARGTLNGLYFYDFPDPNQPGEAGDIELDDDVTSQNYADNTLDFIDFEFTLAPDVYLIDVIRDKSGMQFANILPDTTNFATIVAPAANTVGANDAVFNNWTIDSFDPQPTAVISTLGGNQNVEIPPGVDGFFIYEFKYQARFGDITSESFFLGLEGSYNPADFASTDPFQLYYSVGFDDPEGATLFGAADFGGSVAANEFQFNFNQAITENNEIFFYVKATLAPGATLGSEFRVRKPTASNFTFTAPAVISGPELQEGGGFRVAVGGETISFDTIQVSGVPHVIITDEGPGLGDVTFENDYVYILDGRVLVNSGSTLTIEPGTIIKGSTPDGQDVGGLIVARGASINAAGTPSQPIIFTSEQDNILPPVSPSNLRGSSLDLTAVARWGGIVILGDAPISDPDNIGEALLEGAPVEETRAYYGGANAADNSGTLQYLSIRHGGFEFKGLQLAGVGTGTTIDHIEIVSMLDDGLEILGGAVNLENLLINGANDDGIDIDQSYAGTIDNFRIIAPDPSDHALEIDGPEGAVQGSFTIQNGEIEGSVGEVADFRDGAQGLLSNVYFSGFENPQTMSQGDIELSDDNTSVSYQVDDLTFTNLEATYGATVPDSVIVVDVSSVQVSNVQAEIGTFLTQVAAGSETVGMTDDTVFDGWTLTDFTPQTSALIGTPFVEGGQAQVGGPQLLVYKLAIEARFGAVNLDSIALQLTGSYDANDFGATPFEMGYTFDIDDPSAATSLGKRGFGDGTTLAVNEVAWNLGLNVPDGATTFLYMAATVDSAATNGHTFQVALPDLNKVFVQAPAIKVPVSLQAGQEFVISGGAPSPLVGVDSLLVSSPSPSLSGTVDDIAASVVVSIEGNSYPATVNPDSTWTLPPGTIMPGLVEGTYDVTATATNALGRIGTDTTSNELSVDLTAPVIDVDTLTTIIQSPALAGAVDDSLATVQVAILDSTYQAINNSDGTWSLSEGTISSLAVGTYTVIGIAIDLAGNVARDTATNALTILPTIPTLNEATQVTVSSFVASWTDMGALVANYTLDVAADSQFETILEAYDARSVDTTSFRVTGLDYTSTYYFRVKPVFVDGTDSDYSETRRVMTLTDPGTALDSLALVAIFDSLKGDEWTSSDNWLVGRLQDWYGVQFSEARVRGIVLDTNNLVGAVPPIVNALDQVTSLSLKGNEITSFSAVSGLTALTSIDVSENRLQFGTLERLVDQIQSVTYNDQKEVLRRERTLQETGTTYVMRRRVSGSANVYRWFRGEQELAGVSDSDTLLVAIESTSDEGAFHVEVTNTNIPNLTLKSRPVLLRVSSLERDRLALLAVYEATGGEEWTNDADWPNVDQIEDWVGVQVSNQRVVGLNLSGSNLTGDLPEDILDIPGLASLNLSDNALTALPDLTSLENLINPNVSSNLLQFDDLEPNAKIEGIDYSGQGIFGPEGIIEKVSKGANYRLSAPVGGEANKYQWIFDGEEQSNVIVDTLRSSYIVEDINYDKQGEYTLIVENPDVPGLTLTSRPQEVYATVDIEFIPIYTDIDLQPAPLDEGEAYLLRVIPGQRFDSTQQVTIDAAGLRFPEVILGDYLIGISTDSLILRDKGGRVDSIKLLPTYYRSTFLWEEADTLVLRGEIDGDSLFMQQRPRPLTPADGDGVVGLTVESEFADISGPNARIQARRTVKRAGCSLRRRRRATGGRTENDEFELVAYKETDEDGRVTFNNLPDGTYRLNIEYPGIPMDTTSFLEFEIGAGGLEENTLTLEATVAEEGIAVELVEALGILRKYFKDLQIYPNPADRVINVAYKKLASSDVKVQLLSISGQVLMEQEVERGLDGRMVLQVEDIEEGIYLLRFFDQSDRTDNIMTYRVLIQR